MAELKLNLLELNKLHENDAIKSVQRVVDVGKHLPQDIIGKGTEFTLLRTISNDEFNRLWKLANTVIRNTFIQSSGTVGIEKYIQLIDLEIGGSLDEKRKRVFLEWNRQLIYTHRTLEEILDELLGHDFYEMRLLYNEYGIIIDVTVSRNFDLSAFYYMLRWKILPANLDIELRLSFKSDLILRTQTGDYTYPQYLCGEHTTGLIPRIYFEGQGNYIDTIMDTAIDDAKNYYPLGGQKHVQSQLYNASMKEYINMSDFSSKNVYSFGGENNVK